MKKQEVNKMVELQYIYSAMEILATAFDLCVNYFHIKPQDTIGLFFISNIFEYYDIKSPKFMSGISGQELICLIFEKINIEYKNVSEDYVNFHKSKEYWAMYMIVYYKYISGKTFKEIFDFISITEIIEMYNPLHEASFDKFIDEINDIVDSKSKDLSDKLKSWRLKKNMTQKELSEITGINLRTLQKYETSEKDIMKASYETVKVLKSVLNEEF